MWTTAARRRISGLLCGLACICGSCVACFESVRLCHGGHWCGERPHLWGGVGSGREKRMPEGVGVRRAFHFPQEETCEHSSPLLASRNFRSSETKQRGYKTSCILPKVYSTIIFLHEQQLNTSPFPHPPLPPCSRVLNATHIRHTREGVGGRGGGGGVGYSPVRQTTAVDICRTGSQSFWRTPSGVLHHNTR